MPTSTHAEVLVRVPHLAVIDRLPASVATGRLVVRLTGAVAGLPVVGSLHAHVAACTWSDGRRHGEGSVEVLRGGDERTLLTAVLHGGPTLADAFAVAEAVAAAVRRPQPVATGSSAPVAARRGPAPLLAPAGSGSRSA